MRCETNSGTARTTARREVWVRAAIGSAVGFLSLAGQALAQTPMIEFIQPSAGFTFVSIRDIADDGTIVAMSYNGSAPTTSPILRYSPGGGRQELAVGSGPRISGDGNVIGFNSASDSLHPNLLYSNGTQHPVPGIIYRGQLQTGGVFTHLNHDGSVAMLQTATSVSDRTAFRWTQSNNAVRLPPIPGGSTWNRAYGMSSDGSIVVGEWAFNSSAPSSPMVWQDGDESLTPVALPDGTPVGLGIITTMTGDGRTLFLRYDQSPGGLYAIHDGVTTPLLLTSPLNGLPLFPSGASYDGSVLVGSLGQAGSWIWSQETGVMRAADFFDLQGVTVDTEDGFFGLKVSNDGLHFAAESGPTRGVLVTIPGPGAMVSLILGGLFATARRGR